jgi:predicted nucleic acid-binding protein
MTKYLLDTDILIDYFKLKPAAVDLVGHFLNRHHMGISVLSVTEIRSGWTPQQAEKHLPRLYDLFTVEGVSTAIAEQAGMWRSVYKPKGITLHTVDTMIAATALLHQYWLVTKNTKDYPMPELRLYDGET